VAKFFLNKFYKIIIMNTLDKIIKIFSFLILIWIICIMFVFSHITAGWIIQAIQIAGELITIPAMICVPIFLIYGIIKFIKARKNKDYLLICIVNFLSLLLIIFGFIFLE